MASARPVIIRRNQLGRTPTRGKSNARPLSSGMEISIFPKHGALARNGLRKLAGYQLLRVRAGDRGLRSLRGPAIQFLPAKFLWVFSVPRTVFSGLPRFKPLQKSGRGLSQCFQVSSSFLTACASHMQFVMERFPNERKSTARDGNLTARERNYAC